MEPSVSVTAWTAARTASAGCPRRPLVPTFLSGRVRAPRAPRVPASASARRARSRRLCPRAWTSAPVATGTAPVAASAVVGCPLPLRRCPPSAGSPWAGRVAGEGSRRRRVPRFPRVLRRVWVPPDPRPRRHLPRSGTVSGLESGPGPGLGLGRLPPRSAPGGAEGSAAAPSAAEGSVCSQAARRYSEDSAAETSGADCGAGPRRRRRMNACVPPRGRPRAAWAAAAGWALSDRQTEATTASERTAGGRRDAKTNTRRLINDRNTIRTFRSRRRETRKSRDGGRVD